LSELKSLTDLQKKLYKINIVNDIYLFENVPNLFQNALNSIGEGSKGKSSKDAKFMDCRHALFDVSIDNIKEGIEIIKNNTPGFYSDFLRFVKCIALVDEKASFRGATSINRNGLLFFSPDKTWDKYKWAEELIHECTHCIIYILSARVPLVEGKEAFELKYQGPFRPDPRHLYGNFHALAVLSRCISLFETIRSNDTSKSKAMQEKIKDFLKRGTTPYESLKSDAKFSTLGKIVFDTMIADKFETNLDWHKIMNDTDDFIKPTLVLGAFNEVLFNENDVMEVLKNSSKTPFRKLAQRVYLGNLRSDEYSVKIHEIPINESEDIETYCNRIFEKQEFGIIINNAEKQSEKLVSKVNKLIQPIVDKIGMTSGGYTIAIFIGNYKLSPIGAHIDKEIRNVLHFHLGKGIKEMILWEKQKFIDITHSDNQCFAPLKFKNSGEVFSLSPYSIFNLPASRYFHVGSNSGFSIDIAIAFLVQTEQQIIEQAISDYLKTFYSVKNQDNTVEFSGDFKEESITILKNINIKNVKELIENAIKHRKSHF
jgi:hypothetical protein